MEPCPTRPLRGPCARARRLARLSRGHHHWSAQRDNARETIVRIFAIARMEAVAENIAREDVMLSVAELLAAATEVGALPPDGTAFFLTASAPDSAGLESGRATVQGWSVADRFASVRVAVGGLAADEA